MTSVLHVITGTNVGGAETMLAKLLEQGTTAPVAGPAVVSLLAPGRISDRITACGVPVHSLSMRAGLPSARALLELARVARSARPGVIQGWMHHGNLAATYAAAAAGGGRPVVWNIRHSLVDIALEKPLSQFVLRLGRLLSSTPRRIIYNSAVARRQYATFGFADDRGVVIPNGFDCEQFAPRPAAGRALRQRFGIGNSVPIVAMVARQHPMKDTANLIEAVVRARWAGHDLHLLIAGAGSDCLPPALARSLGMLPSDRYSCVGEQSDVHEWLSGVDILALPSAWGEAFPNILGEAMASGVACVATDVGDSAAIVGPYGEIVPPRDAAALAAAIGRLAGLRADGRAKLGAAARHSIVERYSIAQVAAAYAELYDQLGAVAAPRRRRGLVVTGNQPA